MFACLENKEVKKIWRIGADGSDEFLEEVGYGCIGSGDVFAYTLLKNYKVKELDAEKGKLIVYRVIKEAIKVGAYGLGEPIDIWTGCELVKKINFAYQWNLYLYPSRVFLP